LQLENSKIKKNCLVKPLAIKAIEKKTSPAWCESYGDEHPKASKVCY